MFDIIPFVIFESVVFQWVGLLHSVYYHRCLAHRLIEFHPAIERFFVFCLWFFAGKANSKCWRSVSVAVHLEHHKYSDTTRDPHSPKYIKFRNLGDWSAVLNDQSLPYYIKPEILARYRSLDDREFPEEEFYQKHKNLGIGTLWVIRIILFGIPGFISGALYYFYNGNIISFVGAYLIHKLGYTTYNNTAKNVMPWSLFCGGEDLHNNHHNQANKLNFADKWWEFDTGYALCWILAKCGLAKIKQPK